jgi:hypothetical protein
MRGVAQRPFWRRPAEPDLPDPNHQLKITIWNNVHNLIAPARRRKAQSQTRLLCASVSLRRIGRPPRRNVVLSRADRPERSAQQWVVILRSEATKNLHLEEMQIRLR